MQSIVVAIFLNLNICYKSKIVLLYARSLKHLLLMSDIYAYVCSDIHSVVYSDIYLDVLADRCGCRPQHLVKSRNIFLNTRMCNAFAEGCGSYRELWKPAPTCWEECLFHEGRQIHCSKGGGAKNCGSTQTSSKSSKGKEIMSPFLDVIFVT